MSLLICVVRQDHITLCADTDATRPDGSRFRTSKLLTLPHANAALAGRGNDGFLSAVYLHCLHFGGTDIEGMQAQMQTALMSVASQIIGSGISYTDEKTGLDGGQEIILAGFSHREQRPMARVYRGNIADGIFLQADIGADSFAVAPATWDQGKENAPPLETVADMAQVARAQVAWLRTEKPGCAAGGDLIVAHIERDRMAITRECAI